MSQEAQIQLKTTSILNVPLQNYDADFYFIVNGEEFKTSFIIADLLSPKICKMHRVDPTISEFIIVTQSQGHFSYILELANFTKISLPKTEISFFSEVIELLSNTFIDISNLIPEQTLTEDNVFHLLQQHEQCKTLYSKNIKSEIDFISSHFFNLCENHQEEFKLISFESLIEIISNEKLHLNDEDQLVEFINNFYSEKNNEISFLYNFVLFENVESKTVEDFLNIFDYNDLTKEIWNSISNRLKQPINKTNKENHSTRYEKQKQEIKSPQKQSKSFPPQNDQIFNGIIKYLKTESNGNIESKINITTSSFNSSYIPLNVTIFEDSNKWFRTRNPGLNNWICFDFKDKRINLTNYQIKSIPYSSNSNHLKTWKVEGSNDNSSWTKLDEQSNCNYLNGNGNSHLFTVSNPNSMEFRYIRICNTGPDACNSQFLMLGSVEFYGNLI